MNFAGFPSAGFTSNKTSALRAQQMTVPAIVRLSSTLRAHQMAVRATAG